MYLDGSFGEPEAKFEGGGIGIAAAVGEIVVDAEGKIAPDGSWSCVDRVGCSHHGSNRFDRVSSTDGDGDNGSADEVIADIFEERSFLVLGVMGFDGCSIGVE